MTKRELVDVFIGYRELQEKNMELPIDFLFTKKYNSKQMESEIEAIGEAEKSVNQVQEEYNSARLGIIKKYADLDDSGELIVVEGKYAYGPGKLAECEKEINEATSSIVEKVKKQNDALGAILDEESGITLRKHTKEELKELGKLPEGIFDKLYSAIEE